MKFTEFKFKDYIQEALKDLNFVEATPVQEKLIPVVLSGQVLSASPRQALVRPTRFAADLSNAGWEADSVQAVIYSPSRELAAELSGCSLVNQFFWKEIQVANYVSVGRTRPVRLKS